MEGRKGGRKEGMTGGREGGRKKGKKEGREEGKKEGRKERREGGRGGGGKEGGSAFALKTATRISKVHKKMAMSSPAWEVKTMSVISRSCCGQFVGAIDCIQ